MADNNEIRFETELCEQLEASGWLYGLDDTGDDRARALFPDDAFAWPEDTPADVIARMNEVFDGETKRADDFHSLITLLYAEAASTVGGAG